MTTGANRAELIKAASKPEYVRMYSSVSQFQSDVAEILFDTCQINAEVKIVFDDVMTLEKIDQGGNVQEEIKKQIKFQVCQYCHNFNNFHTSHSIIVKLQRRQSSLYTGGFQDRNEHTRGRGGGGDGYLC